MNWEKLCSFAPAEVAGVEAAHAGEPQSRIARESFVRPVCPSCPDTFDGSLLYDPGYTKGKQYNQMMKVVSRLNVINNQGKLNSGPVNITQFI